MPKKKKKKPNKPTPEQLEWSRGVLRRLEERIAYHKAKLAEEQAQQASS